MPSTSLQFDAALQIIATLRNAGHEAYLAGGCVRDLLLCREPHDYDVTTAATPDVVLDLFPRTFAVGAHFGVVLVSTCGGADAADAAEEESPRVTTEVATFRSDGAYSDGRHPDAVRYTKSAEEDVRRRDFTINGLLLDPSRLPDSFFSAPQKTFAVSEGLRKGLIDHIGGVADLEAGIVRAIGQPDERFEEDHLRMLRAVRFAARFGFQIDPATAGAIRRLAAKTTAVSRERVRDELTKMLTEGHARRNIIPRATSGCTLWACSSNSKPVARSLSPGARSCTTWASPQPSGGPSGFVLTAMSMWVSPSPPTSAAASVFPTTKAARFSRSSKTTCALPTPNA